MRDTMQGLRTLTLVTIHPGPVARDIIVVKYVSTQFQLADMLIEALIKRLDLLLQPSRIGQKPNPHWR